MSSMPSIAQLPDLHALRKSYEHAELLEANALDHPLQQFARWLAEAISAGVPEPNAMTLATVGSNLRPSTRVVLVKGFDEQGIQWFTNYSSRKGLELAGNPYAALQFHWVEQERVVRIEGVVEKVDGCTSDAYFDARPLLSRHAAIASDQSKTVADRKVLEELMERVKSTFPENPPRPQHWGGYRLKPDRFEFWQGRRNRLHDRLCYTLENAVWQRSRLAP